MSAYGNKLNPYRKLREPRGAKSLHQSFFTTNNPSTIGQNQQLLVRCPNLSNNVVIVFVNVVPRSVHLAFEIKITSKDANATIHQNQGRMIVKKTTIRICGNKIMPICSTITLTCEKVLQNDFKWLIKVLARTIC